MAGKASSHKEFTFLWIAGDEDFFGACSCTGSFHDFDLGCAGGAGRIRLGDEHRTGGAVEAHRAIVFDRIDGGLIHQLHH
jgi:hypothetical protein